MKRNSFFVMLTVVFFMSLSHVYAQEPGAQSITIENKIGRITWLFPNSAAASSVFFNTFKDVYEKDSEFYFYNLINPTEFEQIFIDMFIVLYDSFFDCYHDPDEEQRVIMGNIEEAEITDYQLYILSTGFNIASSDVSFIFIHNTVNDEQALFCNIRNGMP